MSIPEVCIDAARADCDITGERQTRARRVINALAENLPESAVEKAARAAFFTLKIVMHDHEDHWRAEKQIRGDLWMEVGSAAIVAALKDVVGETP